MEDAACSICVEVERDHHGHGRVGDVPGPADQGRTIHDQAVPARARDPGRLSADRHRVSGRRSRGGPPTPPTPRSRPAAVRPGGIRRRSGLSPTAVPHGSFRRHYPSGRIEQESCDAQQREAIKHALGPCCSDRKRQVSHPPEMRQHTDQCGDLSFRERLVFSRTACSDTVRLPRGDWIASIPANQPKPFGRRNSMCIGSRMYSSAENSDASVCTGGLPCPKASNRRTVSFRRCQPSRRKLRKGLVQPLRVHESRAAAGCCFWMRFTLVLSVVP